MDGGHIGHDSHDPAALRLVQLGAFFAVQHKAVVVKTVFHLSAGAEVKRCAVNGSHLAGGNELIVNGEVAVGVYHKLMRKDVSPACKVKIAMVREVEHGVLVAAGSVAYDELIILRKLILHTHCDITRKAVAPVGVKQLKAHGIIRDGSHIKAAL